MSNCKYFGIDGICGCVGDVLIIFDFVFKLGWVVGKVLVCYGFCKIIIGKDMCIFGYMLELVLEVGLVVVGFFVFFIGLMLILVVVYLMCIFCVEVGIVIFVLYNLFYDNGIKFFFIDGIKLLDVVEEVIEVEMEKEISCVDLVELGKVSCIVDVVGCYIEFCKVMFLNEFSFSELKIVVDCVNGVIYYIVLNVLCELGVNVIVIGCELNGVNINVEVGVIDVCVFQVCVLVEKVDFGIVFDGDGDCVIMVDYEGNKVDGDQIMYIIVCEGFCQGQLCGGVVGILMSNMGFELVLKQLGILFVCVKVGDCYVLEKMQEKGWCIGVENFGYVILLDKIIIGDGIVVGLQVLVVMVCNYMSLYDFCSGMKMFLQILVNVCYIVGSGDLFEYELVKVVIVEVEVVLGNCGCVLLCKFGIELLICVMVEGEDEVQVIEFVYCIVDVVKVV